MNWECMGAALNYDPFLYTYYSILGYPKRANSLEQPPYPYEPCSLLQMRSRLETYRREQFGLPLGGEVRFFSSHADTCHSCPSDPYLEVHGQL